MKNTRSYLISFCSLIFGLAVYQPSRVLANSLSDIPHQLNFQVESQENILDSPGSLGDQTKLYQLSGIDKSSILQQMVEQQDSLNLCPETTLLESNVEQSLLYRKGHTQYLAIILCEMEVDQGRYEIVYMTQSPSSLRIAHSRISLVGTPQLNMESKVLLNQRKSNSLEDCAMNTAYLWNRGKLHLLGVNFQQTVANSCQDLQTPQPENLITPTSAGVVRLGMSMGELRQKLPPQTIYELEMGGLVEDFLKVSYHGKSLNLYVSNFDVQTQTINDLSDEMKILGIFVKDPSFMTAEGLRPGTRIEDAIAAYGTATFSYYYRTDSGEEIRFANNPLPSPISGIRSLIRPNNRIFSVLSNNPSGLVGIYTNFDPNKILQETQQYREDAAIAEIQLWCDACEIEDERMPAP